MPCLVPCWSLCWAFGGRKIIMPHYSLHGELHGVKEGKAWAGSMPLAHLVSHINNGKSKAACGMKQNTDGMKILPSLLSSHSPSVSSHHNHHMLFASALSFMPASCLPSFTFPSLPSCLLPPHHLTILPLSLSSSTHHILTLLALLQWAWV